MIAAVCLYALAGAAIGALAGAADPRRQHESAILGTVVAGPLGLLALMVAFKDQRCVALGGTPGSDCPDQAYFDVLGAFLPLCAGIAVAIGAYFFVGDRITARAGQDS